MAAAVLWRSPHQGAGLGATMLRLSSALPVALLITAALFLGMRALIATNDEAPVAADDPPVIEIVPTLVDTDPRIDRTRPVAPDPTVTPPAPPRVPVDSSEVPGEGPVVLTGQLPRPDLGDVTPYNGPITIRDGDATPIVRMEPIYPVRARTRGIEGTCLATFDVLASGTTSKVQASCSSSIFVSAVIRAVSDWRYSARMEEGNATVQRGLTERFDFTLRD